MNHKCEELDLIAEWDNSTKKFLLRCKKVTRRRLESYECDEYLVKPPLDILQMAIEIARHPGEESS